MASEATSKRPLAVAAVIAGLGLFGLAASVEASVADDGSAVAAVFPPWWPTPRIFAAAAQAGDVVDVGASPAVLIVRSQQPGLPRRLRAAGAILLLNPLGAGACGRKLRE
jgi:hypothetical protein